MFDLNNFKVKLNNIINVHARVKGSAAPRLQTQIAQSG